ncbi:hypothetical protein [Rhodococcus sp. OK302]|uniref:hypothetical protein n=1 Tax=Rhodococcus sp. OK302 TaxID=1882769 RepID=UPI0011400BC8|nr:hypothetical protein [Rhodococcus sp. OK302]
MRPLLPPAPRTRDGKIAVVGIAARPVDTGFVDPIENVGRVNDVVADQRSDKLAVFLPACNQFRDTQVDRAQAQSCAPVVLIGAGSGGSEGDEPIFPAAGSTTISRRIPST